MFFRGPFRRRSIQIGNGGVFRRDDPDILERNVPRYAHIRRSDPDRHRALRDLVKEFMTLKTRSGRRCEFRPAADLLVRVVEKQNLHFSDLPIQFPFDDVIRPEIELEQKRFPLRIQRKITGHPAAAGDMKVHRPFLCVADDFIFPRRSVAPSLRR